MKPSRILVCGGRDFNDAAFLYDRMDDARIWFAQDYCIIQGEARGADALARAWAELRGVCCIGVRANWDRYNARAGGIRNNWMHQFCQPQLVIAFPGGTGTADMVKLAVKNNIDVWQP